MSFEMKAGGKALGARFAGLGVATAIAFTITVAPGVALADEAAVVPATDASVVVIEEAAPEVAPEAPADVTAVSEVVTEEAAPATETTAEEPAEAEQTNTSADATQPSAESTEDAGNGAAAAETPTEQPAETPAETPSETPAADAGQTTTPASESKAAEDPQSAQAQLAAEEPASQVTEAKAGASATVSVNNKTANAEGTKTATAVEATKASKVEATTVAPTTTVVAETSAKKGSAVVAPQNIYRLYNRFTNEHLYTKDYYEAMTIAAGNAWQYEGISYVTSKTTGTPVYRLYDFATTLHLWTTDANEYNTLLRRGGWRGEGVAWYGAGPTKVSRLSNGAQHLYTTDQNEVKVLTSSRGWRLESNAGVWAVSNQRLKIAGNWLVSSAWTGGQERYWVAADGNIAHNRYIEPTKNSLDKNAGYRAYAKPNGAVVRGAYKIDANHVLLADNGGRIKTTGFNGWLSRTDRYNDWYQADSGKHTNLPHAYYFENGLARVGLFTLNGSQYYGFAGTGFLATSTWFGIGNTVYHAGAGGKLSVCNDYHRTGYMYAKNVDSPTNYFISTDTGNYKVMVFRKYTNQDPWAMVMESDCGVGKYSENGGIKTFMGKHNILSKVYERSNWYETYHWQTNYVMATPDNTQSFHGFLYRTGTNVLSEAGLRSNDSAGCVRLPDKYASYIWYMCPLGTATFMY